MKKFLRILPLLIGIFFVKITNAETIENFTVSLQPGQYSSYSVSGPYSGLVRENGSAIGSWDNIGVFSWPSHTEADFLWFTSGWMQWLYPVTLPENAIIKKLSYTIEIASEYPGSRWGWLSDVTVNINGVDIDTWTIPGDPNAQYGYALQENHLDSASTQYGWLATWTIDETGTYLEYKFRLGDMAKTKVSDININNIGTITTGTIPVKLTVPNYSNKFGINIFGNYWGDYDYDPTVSVDYIAPPDSDGDGIPDYLDFCPLNPENDADEDGICEVNDNCPTVSNSDQFDNDLDGAGNACDDDDDNDTVVDQIDNCQYVVNPAQENFDNDAAGDICDTDDDNDGILDSLDQCVFTTLNEIINETGCSIGDLCACENNWKNHGAYVSCVARTSEKFLANGLIDLILKDAIVSEAAESSCGQK